MVSSTLQDAGGIFETVEADDAAWTSQLTIPTLIQTCLHNCSDIDLELILARLIGWAVHPGPAHRLPMWFEGCLPG